MRRLVEKLYKKAVFSRHDKDDAVFYFTADDFPGLKASPYHFKNQLGDTLSGAFYCYEGYNPDKLVIFDHGMGMGHYAYMKEIEMLCRAGFRVFSYDHTGCTLSEGKGIRGLSGSLADLDACISALKADGVLNGLKYSVIGHSWGGFAAMNILAYHPDIHSMVAISGFISLKNMHKDTLRGFAGLFRGAVLAYEKHENGKYAEANAISTLMNTNIPSLIIHSLDDDTVSAKGHFLRLKRAIESLPQNDRPPVSFLAVKGKNHNPNYTEDAVKYKDSFIKELTKKKKQGRLKAADEAGLFRNSFDWEKMTEQDGAVWKIIFEHLK